MRLAMLVIHCDKVIKDLDTKQIIVKLNFDNDTFINDHRKNSGNFYYRKSFFVVNLLYQVINVNIGGESMTPRKVFIELNDIVVTISVAEKMSQCREYGTWVIDCLKKFEKCDWGDISEEDKGANDEAALRQAREFHGRIVGRYNNKEGDIMIVDDRDEEHTIVLFREESV
jgi:hypothetical protein